MIENYRQCGFIGLSEIAYHIYQFNLTEINSVKKFGEKYNIGILAHLAYLNGGDMFENYLNNKLEYSELRSTGEELLLGGINKRLAEFNSMDKSNYDCHQFNCLTIDENCNVITCCVFSNVYKKIYDVKNIEEVNIWRKNSQKCKDCIGVGLAYIANNVVFLESEYNETLYNEILAIIKKIIKKIKDKCIRRLKKAKEKIRRHIKGS